MKNRPLCAICTVVGVILITMVLAGGGKDIFWEEPSCALHHLREKETVEAEGQVYQIIEKENHCQIFLKHCLVYKRSKTSMDNPKSYYKEKYILVKTKQTMELNVGERYRIKGQVSFFKNARNPGNFDAKRYYEMQKIFFCIWADSVKQNTKVKSDFVGVLCGKLFQFRCQWKKRLISQLGKKDGEIVSAILLGEKQGIDEDLKELFQKNGIGHILAISGLHLSLLGVGIYEIFRRLSGSYVAGGVCSLIVLSLYVLMIGITISVLRAGILFLFRVGADICGRHYDRVTALGVAFLSTLLYRPMAFYDGAFWLSFGAVFSIIVMVPLYSTHHLQGFVTSVCIQVLLFPVTLYFFFEIPIYSVIINMVIIPLMSILLLGGIVGSVSVYSFGVLSNLSFWLVKKTLYLYKELCVLFMKMPFNRLVLGKPKLLEMAIFYIILFGILWRLWFAKKRHPIGKCLPFFLVFVWTLCIRVPQMYTPFLTVMDVGQGDAIFVRGEKGVNLLIDGGSSDVKRVGKYRIEPFLKSQGVGEIDYVFVSHGDYDHMSGIEELLKRMQKGVGVSISAIVLPQKSVWDQKLYDLACLARQLGVRVLEIREGNTMMFNKKFQISCLAPLKREKKKAGNESFMVLHVKYDQVSMLFTGDLEGDGEDALLQNLIKQRDERKVDILKVAHHGSNQATTEAFLEFFDPEVALISAGRNNRYGHPGKEMVKRLKKRKIPYFCTQDCGAITVELNSKIQYTLKYENNK